MIGRETKDDLIRRTYSYGNAILLAQEQGLSEGLTGAALHSATVLASDDGLVLSLSQKKSLTYLDSLEQLPHRGLKVSLRWS